ncbi:MAG: methyltransferase domain-containing protein [Oligoflexia bacterium]|nr:methyltransferase domain-containing protein [Oligoflexia bacterium]
MDTKTEEIFSCAPYNILSGVPIFSNSLKDHDLRPISSTEDIISSKKRSHYLHRADAHFLLPINKNAILLDVRAMCEGVTIPISNFCKQVYAVNSKFLPTKLLEVRIKQDKISNIIPLVSNLDALPFKDNVFDCIFFDGMTEWGNNTEKLEFNVLQELRRVLKFDGILYYSGWNKIHLHHSNVKLFLFLFNLCSIPLRFFIHKNIRYYTPIHLMSVLKIAGFTNIQLYTCSSHDSQIKLMAPFDLYYKNNKFKEIFCCEFYKNLSRLFIPFTLSKYISPATCVIASCSDKAKVASRIINILYKTNLIDSINNYYAIVYNNRYSDDLPTNYCVYSKSTHRFVFFIKIARTSTCQQFLINEYKNLMNVWDKIKGNKFLSSMVPRVIFNGCVDNCHLMVINHFNCTQTPVEFNWKRIKRYADILSHVLSPKFRFISYLVIKRWFLSIENVIIQAIDFIVEFQKITQSSKCISLEEYLSIMQDTCYIKYCHNKEMLGTINNSFDIIKSTLNSDDLQTKFHYCSRHGDFNFCNLLTKNKNLVAVIDFEHYENEGSPFFDFGSLLLTYFLMYYKLYYNMKNFSILEYAKSTQWINLYNKMSNYYCLQKGYRISLTKVMHILVGIEQQIMIYPRYRNPNSFPMFGEESLRLINQIKL